MSELFLPDVNECLYSPCHHGGRCDNFLGGYVCSCKNGWTGQNCDEGEWMPAVYITVICTGPNTSYSPTDILPKRRNTSSNCNE